MIPEAYVYPPQRRSTCDLFRRRLYLVRKRGQLLAHIQNTHHQCNLPEPTRKIIYKSNREGIAENFLDPSIRKSVQVDFELAEHYDRLIRDIELYLVGSVKEHAGDTFHRLRSLPGIGKILAMTIPYEIHDIGRFPRVQGFASYARLVKCAKESSGKRIGTGGGKMGTSPAFSNYTRAKNGGQGEASPISLLTFHQGSRRRPAAGTRC